MKIWLSGIATPYGRFFEKYYCGSPVHEHPDVGLMVSFYYSSWFRHAKSYGASPMVCDSGAFSAANVGAKVDIDAYIQFCNAEVGTFEWVVVLDDIFDAERSMRAWDYMQEHVRDLYVMPVYHLGEDMKVLDYYAERTDLVGIGGIAIAGLNYRQITPPMEKILNRHPDLRLHAFGASALPVLANFPWYSADCSSWLSGRKYGNCITPSGVTARIGRTANPHDPVPVEVIEWLERNGVPFPIPDDWDWLELTYLNALALLRGFAEGEAIKFSRTVTQRSLF